MSVMPSHFFFPPFIRFKCSKLYVILQNKLLWIMSDTPTGLGMVSTPTRALIIGGKVVLSTFLKPLLRSLFFSYCPLSLCDFRITGQVRLDGTTGGLQSKLLLKAESS